MMERRRRCVDVNPPAANEVNKKEFDE